MTIELPIIECTACGNIVGHLFEQMYNHEKILSTIHDLNVNAINMDRNVTIKMPDNVKDLNGLWEAYYSRYYEYLKTVPEIQYKYAIYNTRNLVVRALLSVVPESVTFPINDNGFQSIRYCCMRTLLCDASYLSQPWEP